MPTDTWPIDSPMLPPLVLRPPHGPRLVRLLVMILAGMFHLGTAGWSVITNGPEGSLAWGVQGLLQDWHFPIWTPPPLGLAGQQGPLLTWMTRLSFSLFGVSEFTARLPSALGVMAAVWFTMRLAERSGGIWRGFVAALILISSPGMCTVGRILTSFPLTAGFITAAFYFLECGWAAHPRPVRRRWFLLVWIAWSGSVLSGGWTAGGVVPLAILSLVLFFREARLRFRTLMSWEGGLLLLLTLAVMAGLGFAPGAVSSRFPPEPLQPVWKSLCWQAGLLFPWSLLLLSAALSLVTRLATLKPLEWNEALPFAWLASGLVLTFATPSSLLFPLLWWPAFAVWAALQLATLHRKSFLRWTVAVLLTALGGIYGIARMRALLPVLFPNKAPNFAAIPDFFWFAVNPIASIALIAFLLFGGAAFCAEWMHNRRFALLAYFAAMIPAGFAFADIGAKFAPYFSDAGIARYLRSQPAPERPVILADNNLRLEEMSSLGFYLAPDHGIRSLEYPQWIPPYYLVIQRDRLSSWKEKLPSAVKVDCAESEHLLLFIPPTKTS